MDFATAEKMFRQDQIRELSESPDGLRFLKLRTLSRREHLLKVFASAKIEPPTESKAMLRVAFDSPGIKDADKVSRGIAVYNDAVSFRSVACYVVRESIRVGGAPARRHSSPANGRPLCARGGKKPCLAP
jgi:hypothetical protein